MTDAKEIRKQLKAELGYNAKMVSVSKKHGSIKFTIRSTDVEKKKIEAFALRFEDIQRDKATQCILRGGNTFCFVEFADTIREALIKKHFTQVESAIEKIKDDGCLVSVEGSDFLVGRNINYQGFVLYKSTGDCATFVSDCYDIKTLAMAIATN